MEINGAKMFVKALQEEGVDTLFAYPGGTAIDLFDALYDAEGIDMILPRHEQALVHAADGYARSTGRVGVCLVTSGPGATNLVTGIATANYDSVPLVCFTGQVPMNLIGNDAFQVREAMEERKKGVRVLVAQMNKNKKFQKEQLGKEGYQEFKEFYKESLKH